MQGRKESVTESWVPREALGKRRDIPAETRPYLGKACRILLEGFISMFSRKKPLCCHLFRSFIRFFFSIKNLELSRGNFHSCPCEMIFRTKKEIDEGQGQLG